MHIEIEWDADKAVANLKKHGVRFEEAATSLLDPHALAQEDADSENEARWVLIGMSASARLLAIVYLSIPHILTEQSHKQDGRRQF